VPKPVWRYTDDTVMALGITEVLTHYREIDQDVLAKVFTWRFLAAPDRGYGETAFRILKQIAQRVPWREVSTSAFDGEGSMGNGAAMRVAPLGAYFAEDLDLVVSQARASAEVTHAHIEGIAGGVAVALAAAWACRRGLGLHNSLNLLETAIARTPASETRLGLERALMVPFDVSPFQAAAQLGNGRQVIAQDTVPFALWNAAKHLDNYEAAIWTTIGVGGDIDTNCAIVGGVTALATGGKGIPSDWLQAREPLR
jgi:ADP-ribosylglycohydrolase